MSGDNSAAAIAQRKKLQEELYEAQAELEELYYDHSVEKQQEALDKSQEDYEKSKQDEMDALDEYLKKEEQVIADSYELIKNSTESIVGALTDIADEYGVSLSDAVIKPWEDGANAIGSYLDALDTSKSAFTEYLNSIKQDLIDLQNEADKTAQKIINATEQQEQTSTSAKPETPKPETPTKQPEPTPEPAKPTLDETTKRKVAAAIWRGTLGWGSGSQRAQRLTEVFGANNGIQALVNKGVGMNDGGKDVNNYSYKLMRKKFKGYAKGSKKINKDQLALIDELGEELVLNAGNDGRLQYISKGSGIVPSDLTERLMEWGQLDPSRVLEQSRPTVSTPGIVTNNFNIDMSIAEVVHIDKVTNDTIPNLTKAIEKQMDSYMAKVNNSLKRYAR